MWEREGDRGGEGKSERMKEKETKKPLRDSAAVCVCSCERKKRTKGKKQKRRRRLRVTFINGPTLRTSH